MVHSKCCHGTEMGKTMKTANKRGRGRPAIFVGSLERAVVSLVRKKGLTGARVAMRNEGVKYRRGKPPEKMEISLPTLAKLAKRNGVEVQRRLAA